MRVALFSCTTLIFLLCATLLPAWEPAAPANGSLFDSGRGEYIWERGFFRVVYQQSGEHAPPPADRNRNGIPDYVEDVATQLVVGHHILCDLSGFTAPLSSGLYRGVAYVEIFINSRARLKGGNGVAFAQPERARRSLSPVVRALRIRIANDLRITSNPTPVHEYFHLIQNAATRLSGVWFHEGTASWSADALLVVPARKAAREELERMLHEPEAAEKVFSMSYNADPQFWSLLVNLCPDGRENMPHDDPILQSRYVDGTPVLRDFTFRGVPIIRAVMERFAVIEHIPFEQFDYGEWTVERRADPRNFPHMMRGIRDTVADHCPKP
ncbi:MAG: hypothetical protein LBR94_04215 [Desulfovibrio sp.]|jgi:hypothetical protein|nr:hypothetical protein [Desulfovibrio sp.]